MKKTIVTIIIVIITFTVNGQSISLNDLIKCHKKSEKELTNFLKSKSKTWLSKGHDNDRSWWSYDNGSDASFYIKQMVI